MTVMVTRAVVVVTVVVVVSLRAGTGAFARSGRRT